MKKNRLEAFSDGVLAIIITIMILEMKVPLGDHLADLAPILPKFITYVLSYIYIGIYWNNHHHLWQAVQHVNGSVLWANLHLLFWLSLLPLATGWMGENYHSSIPNALYGFILLMASVAWWILAKAVVKEEGELSQISKAYKRDIKTKLSMLAYAIGIILAFIQPILSILIYAAIAASWFIPDKRIERSIVKTDNQ
ncbi:TMEM175 family protein [Albibacterium bauzanense]|uniref:Putative membrane protein n=1 Tax=Albibacterium bauzanense TaxID=653929 RepID=A0A4R1LU81_9SPHI|nr:TMEM175 family protein [Albibacterium bauzanense]TCK80819.1 putative membrane protein [Albibacterium bauzanense]